MFCGCSSLRDFRLKLYQHVQSGSQHCRVPISTFLLISSCNLFVTGHKANISVKCGFAKRSLHHCFGTTRPNQLTLETKQLCNNGIKFTKLYRQNQLVVALNKTATQQKSWKTKHKQLARLSSSRPRCYIAKLTFHFSLNEQLINFNDGSAWIQDLR